MAGEIEAALDRLNERKSALADGRTGFTIDGPEYAALLSGLDLPADELNAFGEASAKHYIQLIVGNPIPAVIKAATLDGLAIGLLIAEERQKAGQT